MENDNCLYKAKLFILCMKSPTLIPSQNKCKYLFDQWYKCIILDTKYTNEINKNIQMK